jgi:hypothetical protein
VTGLSCHRHLAGQVPAGLSASVGAPEPHDFTVRLLRHSSDDVPRPSHLAPNVRDDREPPLLWVRDKREHRFDLPDNAIPGTCDRLARRASHHLACSHPRVSPLSSAAGCGRAAFPSPQCPTAQMKTAQAPQTTPRRAPYFSGQVMSEVSHAVQCRGAMVDVAYATRLMLAWAGRCCDARRVRPQRRFDVADIGRKRCIIGTLTR